MKLSHCVYHGLYDVLTSDPVRNMTEKGARAANAALDYVKTQVEQQVWSENGEDDGNGGNCNSRGKGGNSRNQCYDYQRMTEANGRIVEMKMMKEPPPSPE